MPRAAVVTGVLLVAVGIGGFVAAGLAAKSVTALIPAVFGVLIGVCGVLGRRERRRKSAMHVAAGVALIGFLMAGGRLGMVAAKGALVWTLGTTTLALMSVLCLAFVLIALRSFVRARRARQA